MAEVHFCDQKSLNMPTMRVTWEAKNQLRDLLISCGFPEECFAPQEYNFNGPDPKLDMVIGLLAMGLYPNVCMHKEKRKVLRTEAMAGGRGGRRSHMVTSEPLESCAGMPVMPRAAM